MKTAEQPVQAEHESGAAGTALSSEDLRVLRERLRRKRSIQRPLEAETKLFKSVWFLILFSVTIMNAFLYVYLSFNDFPAVDRKSADMIIRDAFGKDYSFFSPVAEFLEETKTTDELSFPEFRSSLSKLNERMVSFGIPTGKIFSRKAFRFSNGGIYWSIPMVEGQTAFTPTVPEGAS